VPVRTELDLYGDAGISLTVSGVVQDLECNPIPGAIVEIWHADPTTTAAGDLVGSDSVDYDNTSSEMRYRGQMAADSEGRYSFHTKKPGWYMNGGTFRPMHIHVKVWVGDREALTTQLYFSGDPYIAGDPWAGPGRTVAISTGSDGAESGTFDFTVD
jgi:catechol 1,2-dioxygenase